MEKPAEYIATPAGKHGSMRSKTNQCPGSGAGSNWQGTRRPDGTFSKPRYREQLCPLMKEFCKGGKCAWWLADTELCSFVQAAGALHFLALGGKGSGTSALVESLANRIGGNVDV